MMLFDIKALYNMARYWYSYVTPTGDPRLASSYQLITFNGGKPGCSDGGTTVCAIYSPAGGAFPFSPLSQNLLGYIATALATLAPEPQGSKLFIYMKNRIL